MCTFVNLHLPTWRSEANLQASGLFPFYGCWRLMSVWASGSVLSCCFLVVVVVAVVGVLLLLLAILCSPTDLELAIQPWQASDSQTLTYLCLPSTEINVAQHHAWHSYYFLNFILSMCLCMQTCLSAYAMCACRYPSRPKEGIRFPGAEVTGGCCLDYSRDVIMKGCDL